MATKKKATKKATKKKATKKALEKKPSDVYALMAAASPRARLMADVEEFRVVPTIISSFNRATTVGGAPLSCVWTVHGPSKGGKTVFIAALIRSFQNIGGQSVYVDAEMAADTKRWFPCLGIDMRRCIYLGRTPEQTKKKPFTYEQIVEDVEGQVNAWREARQNGKIPPTSPLLVVIDSINKMVPASLLDKVKGGKILHAGGGREQARMNADWLLALGPMVGDENIIFVAIAHESASQTAGKWGPDYKVRGGGALIYDAMMQVRIEFAGRTYDLAADGAPATGKRHRIIVKKNKHGPDFGRAMFFSSNGQGMCPMGFDRPREILHEAVLRGIVTGPKPTKGVVKMTAGTKLGWKGSSYVLKDFYADGTQDVLGQIAQELNGDTEAEEVSGG